MKAYSEDEVEHLVPVGTSVRVWPGHRPGRSALTKTMTRVTRLGDTPGVYVHPTEDSEGKRVPGGFYALTHVEVIRE